MISSTKLYEALTEMLETGELTDCVFQFDCSSVTPTKQDASNKVLIRAHKVVLSAASPVLKAMLSKEWTSDEKPIEIKDEDAELFKIYISAIYSHILNVDGLKTTIALHILSHKYQTEDVLKLTTKYMIENCTANNVLLITDMAWPYGNKKLRKTCKMVLAKHAKDILVSSEFLEAKTMSVNKFYSLDRLNIESENILVAALDKYIVKNKNDIPEIMSNLQQAVDNIRILLIDADIINKCMDEDFKNSLLRKKRKFGDAQRIDPDQQISERPRDKPTLLSQLPPHIIGQLYNLFNNRFCFHCNQVHSAINCTNFAPKKFLPNIPGIYSYYNHTQLDKYSDKDIISILEAFKQAGISVGSTSMYHVFVNYDSYLETKNLKL